MKKEPTNEVIHNTPISPKKYGECYQFYKIMGYPRHGHLEDDKCFLGEPMIHTNGCTSKDTTSLGYGVDDNLPIYDHESPTTSDVDNEIQPMAKTILVEDFIPSTSIIWGENELHNDHSVEASTSI